jgi:glutamate dehydrogenase
MLRSEKILLVGAFNHLHIFLDPSPNAVKSFKERERLFNLPQSSWEDYDKKLISKGGGIFSRNVRSIELSPEIQQLLDITETSMEPSALINAMLKAPVDLIYNGGIGTYLKASQQSHAEVNDKANDAVRVSGNEIRAKVLGEGGNLGATQLGRVEYALQQGKLYTDAIDNSAGVDCSDHEVNIKILLGRIMQDGDMTLKQRNALLASMTDEVGLLVLRDNYLQTQAISLEYTQSLSLSSVHQRFMRYLEQAGKLSRRIEYLPDDKQIIDRGTALQIGLSQPELSVLLAYSKMDLYQQLLNSSLPDEMQWDHLLALYFPTPLSKKFAAILPQHPLRREIIATELTNRIANRMGITFAFRMLEETELPIETVVHAWYQASAILNSELYFSEIEALDNQVNTAIQYEMLLDIRRQLERITRWILHYEKIGADIHALLPALTDYVPKLLPHAIEWLKNSDRHQALAQYWIDANVPPKLAHMTACVDAAIALLHAIRIAVQRKLVVEEVAKLYFNLVDIVHLDWLTSLIDSLPRNNRWQTLARLACRFDIYQSLSHLVEKVLDSEKGKNVDTLLKIWLETHKGGLAHCEQLFEELAQSIPDLAMISAAIREITYRLAGK